MLDLAIVMPVCNEQACIARVIGSWLAMFAELSISFRMIVINDGSRDGTAQSLDAFLGVPHVEIIHKANTGHGPTVLMGYRKAVSEARWVFQCDSDDEMSAIHFPRMWETRDAYDAIIGIRTGRRQTATRRFISACSRVTVRGLFGKAVADVNAPYRLIRSELLREIIALMNDDTFAPNVVISGALSACGARVSNLPVPHEYRRTGSVSIVKWKLWKAAGQSLWQTIHHRRSFRCLQSTLAGYAKERKPS